MVFLLILGSIATCYLASDDKLFQMAPYQSLLEVGFAGYYSAQDLEKEGDLGLGALEGLSGENTYMQTLKAR